MILKLYIVRDEVACDNHVILTEQNDTLLKRNLKAVMMSPDANYLNTNTKDKRVFLSGELDTKTGVITSVGSPVPVFTLEEVRLELIDEINLAKAEAAASKQKAADKVGVPVESLDQKEEQANA